MDQYLGPKDTGLPRIYERFNDRWEVCVSITEGQFNQVSDLKGCEGARMELGAVGLHIFLLEQLRSRRRVGDLGLVFPLESRPHILLTHGGAHRNMLQLHSALQVTGASAWPDGRWAYTQ